MAREGVADAPRKKLFVKVIPRIRPELRRPVLIALIGVLVAGGIWAVRATRHKKSTTQIMAVAVERRDISLTIEATGTVEPIDLVEVKSKASGQIVRMPVQVGSDVKRGDLLAQIDPRDVQNQYSQALAALRAAQAKASISGAQKKRADQLFAQGITTADEHETATLDYANAQAQLVKARTDVDLARQRREDATVRAPSAGTVIEQTVATGQVISSATSSASGGTTLLKMADLGRIRMRALVGETDIGNVRTGQSASVTVDAYPNRTFDGTVEKIEPQAVVEQSVTLFPVLISLSNDDRLLLPGMNGEVSMLVERRENVPAVPTDAVRSAREVTVVAQALGLDPNKVKRDVEQQIQARAQERASRAAAWGDSGRAGRWAAGGMAGGDSSRRAWRRGGADSTRAGGRGRFGRGQWAGGQGGGARGQGGSWRGQGDGWGGRGGGAGGAAPGGGAGGGMGQGGSMGQGGGRMSRAQVAFVKTDDRIEPRVVRLGLSDFDYAEVLSGLKEGEQVVLLGVAEAQANRADIQSRIRQRMGSGVPGVPGGGGGGRGGGGGGGGGGGRRGGF